MGEARGVGQRTEDGGAGYEGGGHQGEGGGRGAGRVHLRALDAGS